MDIVLFIIYDVVAQLNGPETIMLSTSLFYKPSQENYYLIKKSEFHGESKDDFLTACTGTVFIISDHGLFRYQSQSQICMKIASAEFVEKQRQNDSSFFFNSFDEDTCYKLEKKEIDDIINSTTIMCKFKKFSSVEPFQAVYDLIKTLSQSSALTEELENLTRIANDNQRILTLFSTLTSEDGLFAMEQMRALVKGKNPAQIALGFEYYCAEVFNDSLLAEYWREFAIKQKNHSELQKSSNTIR